MKTRICSRCKQEKPLTSEYYTADKKNASGFQYGCKECRNKQVRSNRRKIKVEDYIGSKIPKTYLTVVKSLGTRKVGRNFRGVFLVLCDCGQQKEIFRSDLLKNATSCGKCQYSQKARLSEDALILKDEESGFQLNQGSLNELKRGAEKRFKDFDITPEDLLHQYKAQGGVCSLTGLSLTGTSTRKHREWSVDRKDSRNDGYHRDSIQFVHKFANIIKNRFSDEAIKMFAYLVFQNLSIDKVKEYNSLTQNEFKARFKKELKDIKTG